MGGGPVKLCAQCAKNEAQVVIRIFVDSDFTEKQVRKEFPEVGQWSSVRSDQGYRNRFYQFFCTACEGALLERYKWLDVEAEYSERPFRGK